MAPFQDEDDDARSVNTEASPDTLVDEWTGDEAAAVVVARQQGIVRFESDAARDPVGRAAAFHAAVLERELRAINIQPQPLWMSHYVDDVTHWVDNLSVAHHVMRPVMNDVIRVLLRERVMDGLMTRADEMPQLIAANDGQHTMNDVMALENVGGSGGSLLPYYIRPMVFGVRDATVVVSIRSRMVRAENGHLLDRFTGREAFMMACNWAMRSSHVEVHTRMGLYRGASDLRPTTESITHFDMDEIN